MARSWYAGVGSTAGRWGLRLATLLLAGCSLSGGNRFTLFPEGHRLIDAAKELRAAAPEPAPLPRELDKRPLPAYVVEPGDGLLVQPVNLDSPVRLPADQPVLPDGSIQLGRYGRLIVAGKTVEQIEADVQAAVDAQAKDAGKITVRLVTRQSKVYYVLGEVNAPGAFQLNGRETVLDAILAAGGLNDRASRDNIILVRPTPPDGCRIVLPICYPEIVQVGDTSTNYQMIPGDRLYVPSRTCTEDLFHSKKKVCPPCGRAHYPCGMVGPGCGGPVMAPAHAVPGGEESVMPPPEILKTSVRGPNAPAQGVNTRRSPPVPVSAEPLAPDLPVPAVSSMAVTELPAFDPGGSTPSAAAVIAAPTPAAPVITEVRTSTARPTAPADSVWKAARADK